jgi:hypothetical protein
VMQLGRVAAVLALGYLQYLIASIRKSLQVRSISWRNSTGTWSLQETDIV